MSESSGIPSLPEPVRHRLRPLARALLPQSDTFSPSDWTILETLVGGVLHAQTPRLRRQLTAFVLIIDLRAWLRFRRGMHALTTDELRDLLRSLERSRLLLFRRGIWGLRTLVFLGYYTRAEAAVAVGYRATAAGWEARP